MFNDFNDPNGLGMDVSSFMDNNADAAAAGIQPSMMGGNNMAGLGMGGLGFGESMDSMNMGMGMIPPDLFSMPMTFEWDWGDANLGNM